MSPYRQPAPNPNHPLCIVCGNHHEYYVSLKHPSGIGSHRVCKDCIDGFKAQHFKQSHLPLPFKDPCECFVYFPIVLKFVYNEDGQYTNKLKLGY